MKIKALPLKLVSINKLYNEDKITFEVPIYQRNYAWEKDEIATLVQDVYDAFQVKKKYYYIGTLVTFHKGDQVYEVIDGQQRLTTINLILAVLNIPRGNKLTYRARKKSNDTIQSIPYFILDDIDSGIINGYYYALEAINEKIPEHEKNAFSDYFRHQVQLVYYQVPKDIDLNHYFEIMNSRGEQLEKHEIIKARLLQKLDDTDKSKFHLIWENCSEMGMYIQQKYRQDNHKIFGANLSGFILSDFDELPIVDVSHGRAPIKELINSNDSNNDNTKHDKTNEFQPIIDFPNFILIVLKLTLIGQNGFNPNNFTLDDKELIREFDKIENIIKLDASFVKKFGFNLLKAKYFLDNYIVHHSIEEDSLASNPWKLEYWYRDSGNEYSVNLIQDINKQDKLVHLLSMFEVSFTARQRKNYLFYCMLHLFSNSNIDDYIDFVSSLANKYINDVYLVSDKLNKINTPNPGAFDESILIENQLEIIIKNKSPNFSDIYGNGMIASRGVPLFIFNFLDYKLWEKYSEQLRGVGLKEGSKGRILFFEYLGCTDFGLSIFQKFYFSRTRRSLEHFYPQAQATGEGNKLNQDQINCLGNYAMIGSAANSSGSDWMPTTKITHYLDASGKINQVSVASLKFMIMMQKCKDNSNIRSNGEEWNFDDINDHNNKMIEFILGRI